VRTPIVFRFLLAVLLATGGVDRPAAAVPPQGSSVKLDLKSSEGRWEGWGTSLCWWANAFGDRDDLADLLFTTNTVDILGTPLPGLGLNIVRYNLGACSDSAVGGRRIVLSRNFPPAHRMQGYWLDGQSEDPQSASWDWNVDASQRAMLLKARQRGANRIELFSNSPMWWMCKNGNPSGNAHPGQDNLAPEHFHDFAVYLATVALWAKTQWNVTFTSVEPFNEPASDFWVADGKQEGCSFPAESQAAFLPLLRAELDKRGLRDMPIAASDENLYDLAIDTWNRLGSPAQGLVQKVNVHGYQKGGGRRDLLRQMISAAGKPLWNSEYGDGDSSGLPMATNLGLDICYLEPRAWCYWQPLDGEGWGAISSHLFAKSLRRINPKYYVLAQYTRHIRPGMTILRTNDPDVVAAYDMPARKLVLVIHNASTAARKEIDLSRFQLAASVMKRWITEPNSSSRYQDLGSEIISDDHLDLALPPDSVQTFEISDITGR